MLITRKSILTGVERSMKLNIDYSQYVDWCNGTPIQHAAPQLSADDREWMMTGITPEEWAAIPFGEDAKLIVVS